MLDHTVMERLGLYRTSPGRLGWLSELFRAPALSFLIVFALAWSLSGSRPHAFLIAGIPAAIYLLANTMFLLATLVDRRNCWADVLYLRSYAKPSSLKTAFSRDVGWLQLLVRGVIRPPYDIVSLFPPAKSEDDELRDARRTLKRGIHHVFSLRTKDDDDWETAVDYLLRDSKLVIVEASRIGGAFALELDRIPAMIDARKVLVVSDEADRQHGEEIQARLLRSYRDQGVSGDHIPLVVSGPLNSRRAFKAFKNDLIAAVKEGAPYSEEFLLQRAKLIAPELLLKMLSQVFVILVWPSYAAAVVAVFLLAF